ncbi:hypothetical protein WICPIJ_009103 [Wickerhamomyces pijperi]|uniref:Uncharacterized protein n=1 Tax=Wickerhamomyces pijperi TaxID=599730 RepID=A0A9P8PQZ6_WICPI|nr:hypothetical protein WICPIJ_009103 [Wickerhamomyces pijperi]
MTSIHQTKPERPVASSLLSTATSNNYNISDLSNSVDYDDMNSLNSSITASNLTSSHPTLTQQQFTTAKSPSELLMPAATTNTAPIMSASLLTPPQTQSISRPLSRSSMASCISTTATKDGIEGKRIDRKKKYPNSGGINGYSMNLIQRMYDIKQQQQQQSNPALTSNDIARGAEASDPGSDFESYEDYDIQSAHGKTYSSSPTYGYDPSQSYYPYTYQRSSELGDQDIDDTSDNISFHSSLTGGEGRSVVDARSISSLIPVYSKEDLAMSLHSLAQHSGPIGILGDSREKTSANASVAPFSSLSSGAAGASATEKLIGEKSRN